MKVTTGMLLAAMEQAEKEGFLPDNHSSMLKDLGNLSSMQRILEAAMETPSNNGDEEGER